MNMNGKAFFVMRDKMINGMAAGITVGVFLMVVMYTSLAIGQPPGDRPGPDHMISMLQERLQLTDEQTGKIRVIFKEQGEKMKALFEKDRERQRDEMIRKRNEIDAMQKETDVQLQSVLTAEQMDEYRALREEEHRKMRHGPRPEGGPGGCEKRPY